MTCFRIVLKILFYLFLIKELFFVPAFANLKNENIHKRLSSENPIERMAALQNLNHTTDKTLHQKVIEIALLDIDLKVRTAAKNALNNLFSTSAVLNDTAESIHSDMYNTYLQKLYAELLSVFPEEQIKALKSLKDIESAHPLVQYIIIKEFVFKSTGTDIHKEITRIAASDSYLQKWLMYVSIADTVPAIVRDAAKDILLKINSSLEFQNELLHTAISDEISDTSRKEAINILTKIKLNFKFQKELLRYISDRASTTAQKTVKYILTHNQYIDLRIEQYLVSVAISNEVSDTTKNIAQDILRIRNLHLEVQERLLNILTAPSDKVSDNQRNIVKDILIWNEFIDIEIDQSLVNMAISDKTPHAIKVIIKEIFYMRVMPLKLQQDLLNTAISDEVSKSTQNAAADFMERILLDLKIEERLLHITTSREYKRKAKKIARAILIRNKLIHLKTKDRMGFFFRCQSIWF